MAAKRDHPDDSAEVAIERLESINRRFWKDRLLSRIRRVCPDFRFDIDTAREELVRKTVFTYIEISDDSINLSLAPLEGVDVREDGELVLSHRLIERFDDYEWANIIMMMFTDGMSGAHALNNLYLHPSFT